jgi:chorismate mutase/prephenate dehydratase
MKPAKTPPALRSDVWPCKVSFLGPEGTFSHMAATLLFGRGAAYQKEATIGEVFQAVMRQQATLGVVPIENSSEGLVGSTLDAMLDTDLYIRREVVLPIDHCLLSRAPELAAVKQVFSHPQALGQCKRWLNEQLPWAELVARDSTAAAAREAAGNGEAAAIASRMAGELQSLPILRSGIQDRSDNATRFVVVGHKDAPRTGRDKTSLAFQCLGPARSLRRALEIFDLAGIELYRVHSRPLPRRAWEYVFFVEAEGHREEPRVARAIDQLLHTNAFVKVLGSYPRLLSA